MKDTQRALRRVQKEKKKKISSKIYSGDRIPSKYADHLKACSCSMCGNPRKFYKEKTIQEKRADYVENLS